VRLKILRHISRPSKRVKKKRLRSWGASSPPVHFNCIYSGRKIPVDAASEDREPATPSSSFVGHTFHEFLSSNHPPLHPPKRSGEATLSTTVLKLLHPGHWTPKKCQPKFTLLFPQSLHRTSTTRDRSGGMGCNRMSRALADQAALVDSSEITVFLHIGQRPSYRAMLRKQLTCIA
jgi:hypothetical protein